MSIDRRREPFAGQRHNDKFLVDAHFRRIFLDGEQGDKGEAVSTGNAAGAASDRGGFLVLPSSDWVALPGESPDEFKRRIVADLNLADEGGHVAYLRSSLIC